MGFEIERKEGKKGNKGEEYMWKVTEDMGRLNLIKELAEIQSVKTL